MIELVRYHTPNGTRSAAIIKRGPKWLTVLPVELPMRTRKVAATEERHMEPLLYKGQPYPVSRFKRLTRSIASKYYGNLRKAPKSVREALR